MWFSSFRERMGMVSKQREGKTDAVTIFLSIGHKHLVWLVTKDACHLKEKRHETQLLKRMFHNQCPKTNKDLGNMSRTALLPGDLRDNWYKGKILLSS